MTSPGVTAASTSKWIGSDIYPTGKYPAPNNTFSFTYVPLSKDREFLHAVDRICGNIWQLAHTAGTADAFRTVPASEFMNDLLKRIPKRFSDFVVVDTARLNQIEKELTSRLAAIDTKNTMTREILNTLERVLTYYPESLYEANKMVRRISNFALTREEFAIVNKPLGTYETPGVYFDCFRFAFFHLHEENAFDVLFDTQANRNIKSMKTIAGWGYVELTETDLSRVGDLIMYIKDCSDDEVAFTHVGIVSGKDHAVSKWGSASVNSHDRASIALRFGNGYFLYRKVIKFALVKAFKADLEEMERALLDDKVAPPKSLELVIVKHPVAHHVRSTQWVLLYCGELFEKHVSDTAPKMLPRSLMGRRCLPLLARSMEKAVMQLLEPLRKDPLSMTRLQAIIAFKKEMLKIDDEFPLDVSLLTTPRDS